MEKCLLHIELTGKKLPGTNQAELKFQMKGEPELLCRAIRKVMDVKQEIAAQFIVAVIHYANGQGFNCGDLQKMAYIPGFKL